MKFLFVARQKKNVDAFRKTIALLLAQGHTVRLAMQDREADSDARLIDGLDPARLSLEAAPTARGDDWRTQASLVRRLRDWAQYFGRDYARADRLRHRVVERLLAELGISDASFGDGLIPGLGESQAHRLQALLARIEATIPSDPLHREFIERDRPDVVIVTPGVHFGSAQADFIKSARAAGIPVWMLVFSWDNLSTKGALHVAPDLMFVWNERQRREAETLHGYPGERVIPVGAPRFDEFFALRPALSRQRFFDPLGLDADAPALLYLCSSRFVARHELSFIQKWLAAVRADPVLRRCNVMVRPHPDIHLLDTSDDEAVTWPGIQRAQGWVSRPFSDDRAIVLRTTYATPQAFFECLHHSSAVVGLNTSAELEAGIAGRRVFTVMADDAAVTGQANTLHFHYLLRENGGFVESAADLATHMRQLASAVESPQPDEVVRSFVQSFLRPRGDRPVAEVLSEEIDARSRGTGGGEKGEGGRGKGEGERQEVSVSPAVLDPGMRHAGIDKPMRRLRVAYSGSGLRVFATPETRKRREEGWLLLDADTVAWLDEYLQPTDVFYDIGAGIGDYSLIAATHRNALVVAIEPGFASYKRLCENMLLNDCRQSIIPLPLALGDRNGLLELQYTREPGEAHHRLKPKVWRRKPYDADSNYVQPVCADRLDEVIGRYELPRPAHVRIHARGADAVARGAIETLSHPAVKSVLVVAPRREIREALEQTLAASGLAAVPGPPRKERQQRLIFVRSVRL
jgi:FkbM family methyltransferase